MIEKFKNKVKAMLSGRRKDTSVDHQDTAQTHIDRVEIGISTVDLARQLKAIRQLLLRPKIRLNYDEKHFGMTSYQKWHKSNKKWR
ncbi:hypothetical protein C0213_03235 [Latilactobacillus sakei]|nr:hypothetical protein C0213_03235 [Latilactobacillus sakei]